jgi:basic membrane protein A and related proteins
LTRIAVKRLFAVVPALLLIVTACGTSPPAATNQSKVIKVALILPCPNNDGSWCQQAYIAAQQLEKEGLISLQVTSSAPQDTLSVTQIIQRYATNGSQLIIADSTYQDAAFNAATTSPNTAIAFAGGGKVGGNVSTFEEPIFQPAYLAGMVAAGISKTGVIGGLAAFDIPLCHAQMVAFGSGAQSIKPSVKEVTTYIGDFNDVAKGKNAALAQADQKADVFAVCGGGPASGMISAIQERNLSGFGYVGNQNSQAPKNMVGSLVYNLYPIFKAMVKDVAAGTYTGKDYDLGLSSFDFVLNSSYSVATIPPDLLSQVQAKQKAILGGTFTVPYVAK